MRCAFFSCLAALIAVAGGSVLGARRPWRYEDHVGPAVATPCGTSGGGVSCPAPATGCCVSPYSPANKTGCTVPAVANATGPGCQPPCHHPGTTCCTPGAALPLSSSLKNILVFGQLIENSRALVKARPPPPPPPPLTIGARPFPCEVVCMSLCSLSPRFMLTCTNLSDDVSRRLSVDRLRRLR